MLSAALPPATLQSLLRALASLGPRLPTLLAPAPAASSSAAAASTAAASSAAAGLPPLVTLCGSLVHLVRVCGHAGPRPRGSVASAPASAEAARGAGALGLGEALPAYVALLHACVAPFAAHALPAAGGGGGGGGGRGGTAAEESDEEPMEVEGDGAAAAAGGVAAAGGGAAGGAAVLRESLVALMAQLCAAEHVGALWHAVLAPHATEAEQQAVPLLSAVFCTLRHGADGRGAPQPTRTPSRTLTRARTMTPTRTRTPTRAQARARARTRTRTPTRSQARRAASPRGRRALGARLPP